MQFQFFRGHRSQPFYARVPALSRWRCARALSLCLGLSAIACGAAAQGGAYPAKTISLVVGYPPGGQTDVIARSVAQGLQKSLGQTIIVENQPGAGGSLGVQKVLNAPRDGYTLIFGTPIESIQTPMAIKVKYKAEDLKLVGTVASSNLLLLVRPTLKVDSVADFAGFIKRANRGTISFGSVGRGSGFHLVAEKFAKDLGVELLHVPYRGVAPLLSDLAGGQIDMAFMSLGGPVLGMIQTGKLKAIGYAAAQRHQALPNVPTMNETGLVQDFVFDLWAGLLVPQDMPQPFVSRLSKALFDTLHQAQFRADLEATGVTAASPQSLDDAAKVYAADIARYRAIGRAIELQPE